MACPFSKECLGQVKLFIDTLKSNPELLDEPEIQFFSNYVRSLGGVIPERTPTEEMSETITAPLEEEVDSDPESLLEFDMTGCIEPDNADGQEMGDVDQLVIPDEDYEKAEEIRRDAIGQFGEGNFEKAIELYTEAIKLNPQSTVSYFKRGQAFLKMNKPNACIKDCDRALYINADSAAAYKFRGRANQLLGNWENAAKDLRLACKLDFDEQTDQWLKDVSPNAVKLEQHKVKKERKLVDKLEKKERERIKKEREERERARTAAQGECPRMNMPNFSSGPGDFYSKLGQDPDVLAALQDPEIAAAFMDISKNPANFLKYQNSPKILEVIKKVQTKYNMPTDLPDMCNKFTKSGEYKPGPNIDDDGLD